MRLRKGKYMQGLVSCKYVVESHAKKKEAAEILVWFLRLRAQKKQTIVTRMPDDYAGRSVVWDRARQISRLTKFLNDSVSQYYPFLRQSHQKKSDEAI